MAVSEKEFGMLLGEVQGIKKDIVELERRSDTLHIKVDAINSKLDQASGGMKVAMAVSGFLGALAMLLLTKVLPLLFTSLPRI